MSQISVEQVVCTQAGSTLATVRAAGVTAFLSMLAQPHYPE